MALARHDFQENALNLPFTADWRGRWFYALAAWLLYVVTFEAVYARAGRTAFALGVLAPVAVAAMSGLAPGLVTMLAVQCSNFILAKLVGLWDPHPFTNAALSTSVTSIPLFLTSGLRFLLLRMTGVNRQLDAQIEQRKLVERALERNLALHRNLLSSLGEGVAGFDSQDRFLFANEATGLLLGVKHETLLGRPLSDFLAQGSVVPTSCDQLGMGSARVSYDLRLNGHGQRTVLVTQTQMSHSVDSEILTLRVMRDITERERLERDRFELEQHLQRTEALQSLAVLAGGVAHDVNNLLTGVIGCTELGLRRLGPFPGEVGEQFEEARRFAFEASELSRKMLAYAGKHQFTPVPLDLASAVLESLRFVRSTVSDRLSIVNQIPTILPHISADHTAVHQVTTNLVLNAAEATPSGAKGRLVLSAYQQVCQRELRLSAEEDSTYYGVVPLPGEYVVLSITDSGTGMSVETRRRLFEPFYSTKAHGRGMGLAATMAIVKSLRGGIAVRSQLGQGSTFLVYWPIANQLPTRASEGAGGSHGHRVDYSMLAFDSKFHDGTGLKLRS